MSDLISRQAAIDELRKSRFLVDAMEKVIKLPSAQQEIIQCKDCKYSYAMITAKSKDGQERWERFCDKHKNWYPKDDWFCADGEGKEK